MVIKSVPARLRVLHSVTLYTPFHFIYIKYMLLKAEVANTDQGLGHTTHILCFSCIDKNLFGISRIYASGLAILDPRAED